MLDLPWVWLGSGVTVFRWAIDVGGAGAGAVQRREGWAGRELEREHSVNKSASSRFERGTATGRACIVRTAQHHETKPADDSTEDM